VAGRVLAVTIAVGAAGAAAAAALGWYTNSWALAQHHAGFPLRYPVSVFNLKPELAKGKLIRVTPCAATHSTGQSVWAAWGTPPTSFPRKHARELWFAQTDVRAPGWPCSNQGMAGLVRTTTVAGNKAYITAYCSPAVRLVPNSTLPTPPRCSSRWVSFDLTWHQGKAWIRAESWGFHSGQLVDWARALRPVP
jgi:hypothetical protein